MLGMKVVYYTKNKRLLAKCAAIYIPYQLIKILNEMIHQYQLKVTPLKLKHVSSYGH